MVNSLQEHLTSQKPAAAIFDSALNLSTRVVKSINDVVKRDKNPLLWSLISEICNANGVLYQLSRLVRDGSSFWLATVWTLCASSGPLEGYTANLDLLDSKFSTNSGLKVLGTMTKSSSQNFDIAKIREAIGKQTSVFLAALQNDHVCVDLLTVKPYTHTVQGIVESNGDCIPEYH